MAVFSERRVGYKAAVVLYSVGVVVFIVGFAFPYWVTVKVVDFGPAGQTHSGHDGLWLHCYELRSVDTGYVSTDGHCVSSGPDGEVVTESWFKAVQGLQCIALIGFLLADCYGVYVNWCTKSRVFNRYLESVIGFSGVVGLIGAVVCAAKQTELQKDLDRPGIHFQPVAWALIVDVTGCALTIVAAILIAINNKPLPSVTPSTTFQSMPPGTTAATGTTFAHSNPAAAPYIVAYIANPQPACNQGQPMAVHNGMNPSAHGTPASGMNPPTQTASSNGMNPPTYNQQEMKSQSPMGAAGGPPTSGAEDF